MGAAVVVVVAVLDDVKVGDKFVTDRQVGLDVIPQGIEFVAVEGTVDAAPVDAVLGARFLDDEAVSGRAAGAVTSGHQQGASVGQYALAPL